MESLVIGTALLNLYALILVLLRGPLFRVKVYKPMLWNIWLSVLPLLVLIIGGLSSVIVGFGSTVAGAVLLAVTVLSWLLLLPNASYLITELNLSHREEGDDTPLWYDIVLVISLAMSGVMNTMMNILLMHILVSGAVYGDTAEALLKPGSLVGVAVVIFLLGFGMYLGRYPRFNSWDLKHPISFARKLSKHFGDWKNVVACAGFTFAHAIFLSIIYVIVAGSLIQWVALVEHVRIELG